LERWEAHRRNNTTASPRRCFTWNRASAVGAKDDSPALQRWVGPLLESPSPVGTAQELCRAYGTQVLNATYVYFAAMFTSLPFTTRTLTISLSAIATLTFSSARASSRT